MGLALDYCVKYSALDARQLGLNTNVIVDGCRGIELKPGDIDRALDEMKRAGAVLLQSTDFRDSHNCPVRFGPLKHSGKNASARPARDGKIDCPSRLAEVALARNGSSATVGDGLAEACQHSPSSYDDGAADGTAGLAGIKVQASVQGEAASSTSVPARSANNGIGFHNVKIAVGA